MRISLHHEAWLSVHPERTAEWLSDRLKDGFDVHHLDGNHDNNDPLNLVLIECADHMMLHNGKARMSRLKSSGGKGKKRAKPKPPVVHVERLPEESREQHEWRKVLSELRAAYGLHA